MVTDILSEVAYQRNRVLFIHLNGLNQIELNIIIIIKTLMIIILIKLGTKTVMLLINSYKNGACGNHFYMKYNPLKEWWELILKIGENTNQKSPKIPHLLFGKIYRSLSLYGIYLEKRYTIDDEEIKILKKNWYCLIGKPECPDGTSTYHEYFLIHHDLFDRILETDENTDILLKVPPQRYVIDINKWQ